MKRAEAAWQRTAAPGLVRPTVPAPRSTVALDAPGEQHGAGVLRAAIGTAGSGMVTATRPKPPAAVSTGISMKDLNVTDGCPSQAKNNQAEGSSRTACCSSPRFVGDAGCPSQTSICMARQPNVSVPTNHRLCEGGCRGVSDSRSRISGSAVIVCFGPFGDRHQGKCRGCPQVQVPPPPPPVTLMCRTRAEDRPPAVPAQLRAADTYRAQCPARSAPVPVSKAGGPITGLVDGLHAARATIVTICPHPR